MLVRPALPGVKPPRLQDLDVVHARYRGRHLVAEIGVRGPLDGALDDALHDRGGIGNRYLLGTWVLIAPADTPGIAGCSRCGSGCAGTGPEQSGTSRALVPHF